MVCRNGGDVRRMLPDNGLVRLRYERTDGCVSVRRDLGIKRAVMANVSHPDDTGSIHEDAQSRQTKLSSGNRPLLAANQADDLS